MQRVILKQDGTVVTIDPEGPTTIEKPNGDRITYLPDGVRVFEWADGKTLEIPPKLARHERPLNVVSTSGEEIGRLMSNFALTPFELDGRRFSCVEAFYVFLKFPDDPQKQRAVRMMDGREAKRFGRGPSPEVSVYEGITFAFGSPQHHALIQRAIAAKLQQNPEVALAFAATHPRPIMHDTGRPEPEGTSFPAAIFIRILTDLRQQLVALR